MSTEPRLKNSLYCEGSMLCALLTPKALIACTCRPETRPRKENKPADYRESSFSQLEFKVRLYYSVLPALTIRVQSCAILNLRIQEHDGHQHAMHAGIVNRKKNGGYFEICVHFSDRVDVSYVSQFTQPAKASFD